MTEVAVQPGRGEPEVRKMPIMRRAMARRMVEAAAVPCFYLRVTADVSGLVRARKALRDRREGAQVPSVNDAIVHAVARELRAHPGVNSAWGDNTLEVFPRVNVGVAVAVPGGLVVPAVYDADEKDLDTISSDVREVARLAGDRKLGRAVLSDATFSVSNLGMFGIEDFDPVLNSPQAAILGVGAVGADGRMRLTLGCDHRALTGAEGAPFLTAVKARLEDGAALFYEA